MSAKDHFFWSMSIRWLYFETRKDLLVNITQLFALVEILFYASYADFFIRDFIDKFLRKSTLNTACTERGFHCVFCLHKKLSLLERLIVDDLISCRAPSLLVYKVQYSLHLRARVARTPRNTHLLFVSVDVVDEQHVLV